MNWMKKKAMMMLSSAISRLPAGYRETVYSTSRRVLPNADANGSWCKTNSVLTGTGTVEVTVIAEPTADNLSNNGCVTGTDAAGSNATGLSMAFDKAADRVWCFCGDYCIISPDNGNSLIGGGLRTYVGTVARDGTITMTDGTTSNTITTTLRNYAGRNIFIASASLDNTNGKYILVGNAKYIKWVENNITLLEAVSCYRESDNLAGFYDLVQDTFYYSANSANPFLKGADA